MVKRIVKSGNSGSITIDKAILDLLGIRLGDYMSLTVHDGSIVMTPVGVGIEPERIEKSLKRARRKYDGALKRLAK